MFGRQTDDGRPIDRDRLMASGLRPVIWRSVASRRHRPSTYYCGLSGF